MNTWEHWSSPSQTQGRFRVASWLRPRLFNGYTSKNVKYTLFSILPIIKEAPLSVFSSLFVQRPEFPQIIPSADFFGGNSSGLGVIQNRLDFVLHFLKGLLKFFLS